MVIHPRVRGFICVTTHPHGCELNVRDQITVAEKPGKSAHGPKRVLVVGASTGYGLASRITAAFGYGAATLGVFFEKPGTVDKPGTAGWYNSAAFDRLAKQAGLYSKSINGDAFSDEARAKAIEIIKNEMGGPIDLVVYSLASPVRKLPETGEIVRSALKTIGETFTATSVDTNKNTVVEVSVEPATEKEIEDTVTVMGGEDWALWIDALAAAGVLADGAKTVAYSYIGTEITWPIYWHGALGRAKQHLERTADALRAKYEGKHLAANVAVMKTVVTQASAAIPVIPLYVSLVFKVMKDKGLHEGTIEQTDRLFHERLYRIDGAPAAVDEHQRIRLDDWELRDDVQQRCKELWPQVTTENLFELTDYTGYKHSFLQLFGFDRPDVDYDADVPTETEFDCVTL